MTDPALEWLRNELEDARERCRALEGVDAREWADYAVLRAHEDRRAALAVLDRVGEALDGLYLPDPAAQHDEGAQENLQLLHDLRDAHREES